MPPVRAGVPSTPSREGGPRPFFARQSTGLPHSSPDPRKGGRRTLTATTVYREDHGPGLSLKTPTHGWQSEESGRTETGRSPVDRLPDPTPPCLGNVQTTEPVFHSSTGVREWKTTNLQGPRAPGTTDTRVTSSYGTRTPPDTEGQGSSLDTTAGAKRKVMFQDRQEGPSPYP